MNKSNKKTPKIWVLVDDAIGNANQAIALAKALNLPYECQKLQYSNFAKLPNQLLSLWPLHVKKSCLDMICAKEMPDIVISSGRRPAAFATYLRHKSGFKTKIIQIMKPLINSDEFALIVLPQHDKFNQILPNIVRITGALTNIASELTTIKQNFSKQHPKLKEFIAVVIGGSSKKYDFTLDNGKLLLAIITKVQQNQSLPLFITFSRRTPIKIKELFKNNLKAPHIIYDPSDDKDVKNMVNPYPGIITMAKYIITTTDSISMCSEAASTGNPIYVFCPENFNLKKHKLFIKQLVENQTVKRLETTTDHLDTYEYTPLREVDKIARIIKDKIISW